MADGMNDNVRIVDRQTLQELTSFGDGGRQPGQFYGVHSIAIDSKGNLYTTETWEGKRLQTVPLQGHGAGDETEPGRRLAGIDVHQVAHARLEGGASAPPCSLSSSLTCVARVSAHDIPRDVTVQAFAKPEGHTFRLLVRVPLKAIMDIEFPRRERDYVDLARIDQSLRDAAMIWLARKIELYEEDALVPEPRILSTRMSLESDRVLRLLRAGARACHGSRADE